MAITLNDLKKGFEPYTFFWKEWSQHTEINNWKEDEIFFMNLHIANKFRLETCDLLLMFYNRPEVIGLLTSKLRTGYSNYQQWVIEKFHYHFVGLAVVYGFQKFFATEISVLDISYNIKSTLNEFNIRTPRHLFINYTTCELKEERNFYRIQTILKLLIEAEKIMPEIGKEVVAI